MSLTASVLHDDGIALLALDGELDTAEVDLVQDAVDGVLAAGFTRLVVDLTALTFCDSTGLGTLVRTHRRLSEAGGSCVVAGARGPVHRLLHLMRMGQVLELVDDVSEGLRRLQPDARGA